MANEFKVKKGLIVQGSGSTGDTTILDVQGNQGQLFSVTDSLSGSLFSVGDISGVPILEVFSNEVVKIGTFGSEAIIVHGSNVTSSGAISASLGFVGASLDINGNADISGQTTLPAGTAGTPSIAKTGDTDTGLYWNGTNELAITTGGTQRMTINSTRALFAGEVEASSLDINGDADISGNLKLSGTYPRIFLTDSDNNDDFSIINNNGSLSIYNDTDAVHAVVIGGDSNAAFAGNISASGAIDGASLDINGDADISGNITTATWAGAIIPEAKLENQSGTNTGDNAANTTYGNVTNESKATMFTSPTFTGNVTASGNISSSGTITANSFVGTFTGGVTGNATGLTGTPDIIVGSLTATSITSSIVTSSIIYTEGSNIFGDTISDTHLFNGHITASGNISASGTGTHTFGGNVKIDNPSTVGQLYIDSAATSDVVINLSNNDVQKSKIGWDHSESALAFVVGTGAFSAAGMVLDSTGVGIGTTSPSAKLHLIGNIIAEQPTNTNAEIKLNPNSSALGTSYAWNLVAGNSANSYGFDIKQGTTSILRINNSAGGNNNVGIGTGTTSPTEKLTVVGDISASGDINVNNNSQFKGKHTNGTEYGLLTLTSGNVVKVGAYDYQSASTVFGGGDNAQFLIGSSEVMRLRSTGLEVTGHITASGDISASGAIDGASLDINGSADISGDLTGLDNATSDNYYINDTNTRLHEGSGNALRITTGTGYIDIGSQNSGWIHFQGNKPYYFNQALSMDADLKPYNTNEMQLGLPNKRWLKVSSVDGDFSGNISASGNITASGNISASGTIVGSNLSGTNTGDQDLSGYLLNTTDTFAGNITFNGGNNTSKESFLNVKRGSGAGLWLKFQTDSTSANNVSQFVIRRSTDNVDILSLNATTGKATFTGDISASGAIDGASLDINGNADISGNITTATWAGAIIPEAKLENQSGTNTGDNAANTTYGNVTNESKATMFTSPTFTGNVTASGNISSSGTGSFSDGRFTGKVGIGTTTPSAKLDVQGGANGHVIFRNSGTSAGNGIRIIRASSSDWAGVNWYDNTGLTWAFGENSSGFGLFEDGLAAKTRLMVKAGGNIGIGTTSPGEKLEVVGNISASGAIDGASLDINGAADMSGVLNFSKTNVDAESSENFFRIKFKDVGGVHNDVGIGQSASNNLGFNTTAGGTFTFNDGTNGNVLTISDGQATFDGEVEAASLDINGDADISGNITTATWAGAIIPEAKLENQSGTNTGDNAANTTYGNVTNESKATMFTSPTFTGNVTASGNISASGKLITERLVTDAIYSHDGNNQIDVYDNGNIGLSPYTNSDIIVNFAENSGVGFNILNDGGSTTFRVDGMTGNITSSGNISASGNLYGTKVHIPTNGHLYLETGNDASQYITCDGTTLQIKSNDLYHNGNSFRTDGHITASGNISSSGTITANEIHADSLINHTGDANTGLQFSSDTVTIQGNNEDVAIFSSSIIRFTEHLNSTHYISGSSLISDSHITASGNISASGTITADSFAGDGSNLTGISADSLADNSVDTAEIAALAVETAKINNLAVTTAKIADDAVTYAKIQNVSATNVVLGRDSSGAGVIEEIAAADLVAMLGIEASATADQSNAEILTAIEDGVDSVHYKDASIDAEHLASNSVTTAKIADDAVTGAKIENNPTIAGNLTVNGNTVLGNASTDTTTIKGNITASGATLSMSSAAYIQTPEIRGAGAGITQLDVAGEITASGNISSSATITANVIQTPRINATGGSLYIADPVNVVGHITASGNIKAAGTITANEIHAETLFSHAGDANTGLQFSADTTTIQGNNLDIATFASNRIELNLPITTNITASGNISSSAYVYSQNIETFWTSFNCDGDSSFANSAYGPNTHGINYYHWNKNWTSTVGDGGDPTGDHVHRSEINTGWYVPYKIRVVGFSGGLTDASAASTTTCTVKLFNTVASLASSNYDSNTGTTKALVASSGNVTLNGNRWKHYNITGLSVDLEEGQYVLPRITMGEELNNLRGQFTIKYHRIA